MSESALSLRKSFQQSPQKRSWRRSPLDSTEKRGELTCVNGFLPPFLHAPPWVREHVGASAAAARDGISRATVAERAGAEAVVDSAERRSAVVADTSATRSGLERLGRTEPTPRGTEARRLARLAGTVQAEQTRERKVTIMADKSPELAIDDESLNLGDAGKRAIAEERRARKDAEKAASETRRELESIRAELEQVRSEQQKAIDKAREEAAAEARAGVFAEANARLLEVEIRRARPASWPTPPMRSVSSTSTSSGWGARATSTRQRSIRPSRYCSRTSPTSRRTARRPGSPRGARRAQAWSRGRTSTA